MWNNLPTKFGSDTSSLEEGEIQDVKGTVTNYTFDRKNYKKPDVVSIVSGSTTSVRDLTRPTGKLDPVIVLSSSSSQVSSITSNDERTEKMLPQSSSRVGKLLVEIDRIHQPIDRVSMWRVTKEELSNSTLLPYRPFLSDSAQLPVTPLRVTTSGPDSGSMIKVRKFYSSKMDAEETDPFKRPKTPSTTSEKEDTPPHTRMMTPKSVNLPSSAERIVNDLSSSSEEDGLLKEQNFETEDAKQQELLGYLGIETITDYEEKLRQQEELAMTRRSSRVKYRQMKQAPEGDSSLTDDSPEKTILNSPPSQEPVTLKRKPVLSVAFLPKKPAVDCEKSSTSEKDSIFSKETQIFSSIRPANKVKPGLEAKVAGVQAKKPPTLVKKVKRSFAVSQFLAGLRSGRNRLFSKYPRRNLGLVKQAKRKKSLLNKSLLNKSPSNKTAENQTTATTVLSSGSSTVSDAVKMSNVILNVPLKKPGLEAAKSRIKVVPTATVTPTQLKTADLTKERSCTMVNPLSSDDGAVLRIAMTDNLDWVVVQERAVSFWKFVRFSAMLGMAPNMVAIGKIARLTYDTEIQVPNACELLCNDGAPVYLELRGKQQNSIESYRSCPVASIYANVYHFDSKKQNLSVNSIQLDSIFGLALDIRFITLPSSRYFIMSWYQLSVENANMTGLTKYSLTPDLKSLASIKNFPTVAYKMLTLNLLTDNRVIGIGETCITIWSYSNGDLLSSMMTSNRIGQNLACVEFSMVNEKYLFLINFLHDDDQTENQRTLKITGWDLMATQHANRVVTTLPIELDTDDMATMDVTVSHKHDLCIVTFHSGQYILISLNNLQVIHQSFVKTKSDDGTLLFNSNNFMVQFAENNTSLIVKDVMQFLLETLNER